MGEQDAADQPGAFSVSGPGCVEMVEARIPAPARRPGAYSCFPRRDGPDGPGRRRTLRTGYCDRKIDERQQISDVRIFENTSIRPSESRSAGSGLRTTTHVNGDRGGDPASLLNGEFDPGSG